jgi:hypothetical protein
MFVEWKTMGAKPPGRFMAELAEVILRRPGTPALRLGWPAKCAKPSKPCAVRCSSVDVLLPANFGQLTKTFEWLRYRTYRRLRKQMADV